MDPFHICAVINGSSAEPHLDLGNLSQAYGFTVPFGNFKGGNIVLHEYQVEIELREGDFLFFDASSIVHSVTPVTEGNRIAAVIWACKNAASAVGISNQKSQETSLKINLVKRLNAIREWQRVNGKNVSKKQ
jgi:predicted 2-oxoglutarate/Fe(II)-dependent dioxygenase YbiX